MAEERAVYRYRIEDIDNEIDNVLALIGRPEISLNKEAMKRIRHDENSKKAFSHYFKYQWDHLRTIDSRLTIMIYNLALKYGYRKEDL